MRQNLTKANSEAARAAFLEALAQHPARLGGVPAAAAAVGVHRSTVYRWARRDPTFAAQWQAVLVERWEREARAAQLHDASRRATRNAELAPMRRAQAARARAAKRR